MVNAFERYLACGDFSRGFVRCHGGACRHDVLVAFSCKGRGVCPKEAGELLSDDGSAAECKMANVICQGGSCSDATLPRYCTWLCRNDGDCTAAAPHCLPQTFGATTMNVCKR